MNEVDNENGENILFIDDVVRLTGLTKNQIFYRISVGRLPKKNKKINGWLQKDVEDFWLLEKEISAVKRAGKQLREKLKTNQEEKEMVLKNEDYKLLVVGYNNLINAIEFIYQMFPECTNVHVVKRIGNNDMRNYDLYLNSLIGHRQFMKHAILIENVALVRSLGLREKADIVIVEDKDLSFYYSKRRGHVNHTGYYFEYYTAEGGAGEIGSCHLGGDYWKYTEVKKPNVDNFETSLLEEFKQLCKDKGIAEEVLITDDNYTFISDNIQANWEWYKEGTKSKIVRSSLKHQIPVSPFSPSYPPNFWFYLNYDFAKYPTANIHHGIANYKQGYTLPTYRRNVISTIPANMIGKPEVGDVVTFEPSVITEDMLKINVFQKLLRTKLLLLSLTPLILVRVDGTAIFDNMNLPFNAYVQLLKTGLKFDVQEIYNTEYTFNYYVLHSPDVQQVTLKDVLDKFNPIRS